MMASVKSLDEAIATLRELPDRIETVRGELTAILGTVDDLGSVKKLVAAGADLVETKIREVKQLDAECQLKRADVTAERKKVQEAERKVDDLVSGAQEEAKAIVEAAKREAKQTVTRAGVEEANIKRAAQTAAEATEKEMESQVAALVVERDRLQAEAEKAEGTLKALTDEIDSIRAKFA